MGWWQVSADTLAASRFVISPLAETTAALLALERGTAAHPAEKAWLDEAGPPTPGAWPPTRSRPGPCAPRSGRTGSRTSSPRPRAAKASRPSPRS